MGKIRLGVVTVISDSPWTRAARDISGRVALAKQIIATASCDLLVLPAGFLVVGTVAEADRTALRFSGRLPTRRPAIAFGVDARRKNDAFVEGGAKRDADPDRDPVISSFGYLAAPGAGTQRFGRQLTITSSQSVDVNRLESVSRVHDVGGASVGFLLCGELLGKVHGRPRKIARVREVADAASVVVDLAHSDVMVRGFVNWKRAIDTTGAVRRRAVVVAQHLHARHLEAQSRGLTDGGEAPRLASSAARRIHVERLEASGGADRAIIDVYAVS